MNPATAFDQYIQAFPPLQQRLLKQLRAIILSAAPRAEEKMSYGMPAFFQYGNLVYIAAYTKHIGFYPHGSPIVVYKDLLTPYKTSKGAIQFPLDRPLPVALIKKIVAYRIQENLDKLIKRKKVNQCVKGHYFERLKGVEVCPYCGANKKASDSIFGFLSKPAQRALTAAKISTMKHLLKKSKAELLELHGFGPTSIKLLEEELNRQQIQSPWKN